MGASSLRCALPAPHQLCGLSGLLTDRTVAKGFQPDRRMSHPV